MRLSRLIVTLMLIFTAIAGIGIGGMSAKMALAAEQLPGYGPNGGHLTSTDGGTGGDYGAEEGDPRTVTYGGDTWRVTGTGTSTTLRKDMKNAKGELTGAWWTITFTAPNNYEITFHTGPSDTTGTVVDHGTVTHNP